MKMRVKLIGISSAVLAGILISTSYLAAHPMDYGMFDQGHRPGHMMHKPGFDKHRHRGPMQAVWQLDLSEEQQEQLSVLMQEKRKGVRDRKLEKREARKALREAMTAEPYDAERVKQLAEAQGAAVTERILKRAETRQQIRALLTPEQLTELDRMRSRPDCQDKAD
jgi:Spy/CpxP family protein refolding chaperone